MKQLIEEQREDFKKNKKTYWDTFGNLATNELIALHSEYLKQFIDELIAREEKEIEDTEAGITKDTEGHGVVGYLQGKLETIAHLKNIKSEII